MDHDLTRSDHSGAWYLQTVISFGVSLTAVVLGIAYLPADPWQKAFLATASLYSITSAISLSKTLRDEHESKRFVNRVDSAKLDRILAEQDPLKVA